MANSLEELATSLGLRYVKKAMTGTAFGARKGYPFSITFAFGGQSIVSFLVLYDMAADPSRFNALLDDKARLKELGLKKLYFSVIQKEHAVRYNHPYYMKMPNSEGLRTILDNLVGLISRAIPPPLEKCQGCGNERPVRTVLLNGLPFYFCEDCIGEKKKEIAAAEKAASEAKADYMKGAGYGILGLLLGAVIWSVVELVGFLAYLVAFVNGFIISYLIARGSGKVDYPLIGIAVVLTIFSIILGDVLYWTFSVSQYIGSFEPALAFRTYGAYLDSGGWGNLGLGVVFGIIAVVFMSVRMVGMKTAQEKPIEMDV